MTIKGSKTHVLRQKMELLGYLISRDGIEPNHEKVASLDEMPTRLATQKDIMRFMGFVNFHRIFIPQLSTMAGPLFARLKRSRRS